MKKPFMLAFLLIAITALFCGVTGAAGNTKPSAAKIARVTITSPVYVSGGNLLLKDIAVIECSDKKVKAGLEKVIVGPSPIAGGKRSIQKSYFDLRFRQQKLDPKKIELISPETIEIISGLKEFSSDEIIGQAKAGLAAFLGVPAVNLDLKSVKISGKLTSPNPSSTLRAYVERHLQDLYAVRVETSEGKSVTVQATIAKQAPEPGSGKDGGQQSGDSFIIRKGQPVTLRATADGVSVSAAAEALDSGRPGDRIKVLVGKTKKIVLGTVVDDGTVVMEVI